MSRMRGNSQVRFLGGWSAVTRSFYPVPNCPVAGDMPEMVRGAVMATEGITECRVELVWAQVWVLASLSAVAAAVSALSAV
ncbi:hypothetical protein WCLP8_2210018 [uncultured Gammaproteobacteria bacterium]